MSGNFPIFDDGVSLSATDSSQVYAWPSALLRGPDVMIDNLAGTKAIFVRAGNASTSATTLSMRVPAGSMQPFYVGDSTHLAYRTEASSTQAFVVHRGSGQ